MSFNSSPFNASLENHLCFHTKADDFIVSAVAGTRLVLLIPISIFVLHLGVQQWRQHRSLQTASHSDILTYNLAVMELIWSLGTILHFMRVLPYEEIMVYFVLTIIYLGEPGFHVLTCVDRYLAVVHPVKYRELRNTRGVTIRNISIFSVWLLSLLWIIISQLNVPTFTILLFFTWMVTSLLVVCFCSLSVLCALFRPGPGAGGGNRTHVDQSKQRAFFTVMAIMGVVTLIFLGFLISIALMVSEVLCDSVFLIVHSSLLWLSLPSSLVLPLILLHKTGKLPCRHQIGQ